MCRFMKYGMIGVLLVFGIYHFTRLEVFQKQENTLELEGGAVVEVHAIAHLIDNGQGPDYNGGLLVEVWTDKTSYVVRMSLSEYKYLKEATHEFAR